MIDKTRCHQVLPNWSVPLLPDGTGSDRNIFNALRQNHAVAWTGRPTVYYLINPESGPQPTRDQVLARRGCPPSIPAKGKAAPFAHRDDRINEYLLANLTRKLHLGSGINLLDGWLTAAIAPQSREVLTFDLARPLPFPDETFDYAASEHFIEHLTLAEGSRLLGECFRILRSGGRVRIATPDLSRLLALYTSEPNDLQKKYVGWIGKKYFSKGIGYNPTLILNNMFYNWGHRSIYEPKLLAATMRNTGFIDITKHAVGESPDANLRGIEGHGHMPGAKDVNAYETMVLEGTKP